MPFMGNCLFLEILKDVGKAVRVALQKVAVKLSHVKSGTETVASNSGDNKDTIVTYVPSVQAAVLAQP